MIQLGDVESAAERISSRVRHTPLLHSEELSAHLGRRVSLKLEMLQHTGSFKPRGAFNQLLSLDDVGRGVVGFSGGNFAQALSYAAGKLGTPALVVMPESTPRVYLDGTRRWGADIELVPTVERAIERVEELVADDGWSYTHPFAPESMIAGNGSLGLEVMADAPDATDVVVAIGGGGFISGVATAVRGRSPGTRVWGVETEGADAMSQALAAGEVVTTPVTSLAKTLGAPYVSELTLETVSRLVEEVVVVSDADAYGSLVQIMEQCDVLTELAASCTLAGAERLQDRLGDHVVLVLCGGNVSAEDLGRYRELF